MNGDESFRNPVPPETFYKFKNDPVGGEKVEKFLTKNQLEIILKTSKNRSIRDYILFLLAVHCGMRISELKTIRIENINFKERYLKTGLEKGARKSNKEGDKPLIFFFPSAVGRKVKEYVIYLNKKEGWLFPGKNTKEGYMYAPQNMINRKYKWDFKFTMHWFRHTLITNRKMFFNGENGKPKISDWESEILMNHTPSSVENKHYTQLPIEEKRKLYDKYHPYPSLL
ncbi:MAG: tyrosine-type recombinase/integrase [Candidatus Hodarchaeota archaeon]